MFDMNKYNIIFIFRAAAVLLLALLASPASAAPPNFARSTVDSGDGWELVRYRRDGTDPVTVHLFRVTDPARRRLEIAAFDRLVPHGEILAGIDPAPVALLTGGFHATRDGHPVALGAARGPRGESPSLPRRFPLLTVDRAGRAAVTDDTARIRRRELQVLQGKPRLLYGGKISPRTADEAVTRRVRQPRAAVGIARDGAPMLVAVDGRSAASDGMTLPELAEFLRDAGAVDALGMDGGGSALLVVAGRVVNIPSGGLDPFTLPGVARPLLNAVLVR